MIARLTLKKAALASVLLALLGVGSFAGQASAEYVEHNVIDDGYFLDATSMSHQDIQNFLAARSSYLASYSSYSDRNGRNVNASQIIYEAAQDYGISPKVILATLQKEQSLVTARNPVQSQVNFAMGYGCPDSTGCGTSYSGFFKQVDNATWQFRFNFERARGNNTWWRANLSYPCGGATRYYSTGLYPGRYITFFDDNGTPIKGMTINNPATTSLYCYTPHPYNNPSGLYGNPQFGYTGQYYSGSFNFVKFYESWFGTTQPGVTITSPLRVTGSPQGIYSGTPVTVSFDIRNNNNYAMGIGSMSVAVRDAQQNNYDFMLKPILLQPYSTVTYTATQNLPAEGTYTMWITNLSGGSWKDNYPTSSSIDNARSFSSFVRAMPTITITPTSTVSDMRQGKAAQISFKVKNNSQQALDVGKVALALRSQSGINADLPLRATGSLAAGAEYTYNEQFTPTTSGGYAGFITATKNNGADWNESTYPALAGGVSRGIAFEVKPSPTLTQGPTLSIASPRVGQQVSTTFKVKNFGDQTVQAGRLGMAIRDPLGRNVDSGSALVSVNANSEYTFQANATFTTPGTYTAWITGTRDGGATWDDTTYPGVENDTVLRKMTFTVLPSPTITVQPTITSTEPRVGKGMGVTFTLHNYGTSDVYVGKVALAARDSKGRNADFALRDVTIPAGGDYVYTATNPGEVFTTTGTYIAWITVTRDNGKTWDDDTYPSVESDAVKRWFNFEVKPSPTLTQGPTLSIASPRVGQQVSTTFKVKNFGDQTVQAGRLGMAIRDPLGRNVDSGSALVSVNANSEYTFQANATFTTPGTYTAWITGTRDGGATWDDTTYPGVETSSVQRRVNFVVQP